MGETTKKVVKEMIMIKAGQEGEHNNVGYG